MADDPPYLNTGDVIRVTGADMDGLYIVVDPDLRVMSLIPDPENETETRDGR